MRSRRAAPLAPLLSLALICAGAAAGAAADGGNKTVHLIFSSHLDVGFTDMDNAVIELHWYTHYPRAITLARWFDAHGRGDGFRYLTHSWLVSLFFDCPSRPGLTCPAAAEQSELAAAIKCGAITWHAAPFNPNYEARPQRMFDADTLGYAFDMTHGLDARFGLKPKAVASLRDVPGLTRGALPVFASRGVRALTCGVNGFSAPPAVPKRTPFVWRDDASGAEVVAMWHEGGYGGWHDGIHADNADDCIKAEGFDHILCVSWRDDNGGPPASPSEAQAVFAAVRAAWPGARVAASTLDEYASALLAAAPRLALPVVTGEIGDTWVHGSASDPLRLADYRAALRARRRCVRDPHCDSKGPGFERFSRLVIKVAEHTWGLAFNEALGDATNYTNAYLHPRLANISSLPRYARVVESWRRQRDYVAWALEELPEGHPIRADFAADKQRRQHHAAASPERLLLSGAAARAPLPPPPPPPPAPAWRRAARAVARVLRLGRGGAAARAAPAADGGSNGGGGSVAGRVVVRDGLVFQSHAWTLELDPYNGGLSRLSRAYPGRGGAGRRDGNDWAADAAPRPADSRRPRPRRGGPGAVRELPPPPPRFLQLRYNVYNDSDFQPVWDDCEGLAGPPFISDLLRSDDAEHGVVWHVKYEFPQLVVRDAGAPAAMWLVLQSPPNSSALHVTVAWQNKTATRLPEATWVRFAPGLGAADADSWRLHKINASISPQEIVLNGSHSIHAVSEEGATVRSPAGGEVLRIRPHDAPLLALGDPRPFPNPSRRPDMAQGVSACLHNNVWGTNYAEWVPFSDEDLSLAFRFTLEAWEERPPAPSAPAPSAPAPAPAPARAAVAES
ncbi:MAG: hypothetical protein J3K34DRAFT_459474 [Monoraphidium minutum]|nr:MAG: hypothetical protein J3K34DRAFT_459474 [Monoraphidium minutum]